MNPLLIFQHIPCEGAGRLIDFAAERGMPMETVHFMDGGALPTHADFSALIALGGSMNVYDEELYPWLGPETRYIADWVNSGRPYLGICLGGQLLAKAIGGRVTKNAKKEIGNFEVNLTAAGLSDPLLAGLPESFPVFQWHGDTFSDLAGGVNLAGSALCANQIFRFGATAYGVQFHVEITAAMANEWLHEYNPELLEEGLDPQEILSEFTARDPQYLHISQKIFSNFFQIAHLPPNSRGQLSILDIS